MKKLGIYVHIPFCLSKCQYCDFCSFPLQNDITKSTYVEKLKKEIQDFSVPENEYEVDTIYFGGGTPTTLNKEQLISILDTIFLKFQVNKNAEITIECNPATGSFDTFQALKKAGFNRISIGLQSANENELRSLGRAHSLEDFEKTLQDVRCAGFENISVDVMFGIPNQTMESWQNTLQYVCQLGLQHISAYGLIIEEGTPYFERKDTLEIPDEDITRNMYFSMIKTFETSGFHQYEISNFAKENRESKHNLKYWNCDEYLGFGPAAYSFLGNVRYGHTRDFSSYIKGEKIDFEDEILDEKSLECEYVMLKMRLNQGVNKDEYYRKFKQKFDVKYGKKIKKYQDLNLVDNNDKSLCFTKEGMYVSNTILSDILDF